MTSVQLCVTESVNLTQTSSRVLITIRVPTTEITTLHEFFPLLQVNKCNQQKYYRSDHKDDPVFESDDRPGSFIYIPWQLIWIQEDIPLASAQRYRS